MHLVTGARPQAVAQGLGTCSMARVVGHPELLRGRLPGGEDDRVAVGIAIGRPDGGAPINRFERSRAALDVVAQCRDRGEGHP